VKEGTNKIVGYRFEIVEKKREHWYFCKLDQKDGRGENVKKIHRDLTKKPSWFEYSSIYGGDCRYVSSKMDDVRKHFIIHHPGISSDYIFKCTNCVYKKQVNH
jgi:hypothetical protein